MSKEALRFLKSLPLFNNLPIDALQALAAELVEQLLPAGALLFAQGDPGDACYFIVSGQLGVIVCQPEGPEVHMLTRGPGEFVGEMALLTGQPRTHTLRAMADCHLLRLERTAFERLAQLYPRLPALLAEQLRPRFQQSQAGMALWRVFGPFEPAALDDLLAQIHWLRLDYGEVLFQQGDPGDVMYIVVQGRLRFTTFDLNGRERPLGELGAGESIGEFALLAKRGTPESRRSATVTATRQTDLIAIDRDMFEQTLCQNSQMLLNLTRRIIRRESQLTQAALPAAGAQVIALLPLQSGVALVDLAHQLSEALESLGPTQYLDAEIFNQRYGKAGAAQTPLDGPDSLVIDAWLDERECEVCTVVLGIDPVLGEDGRLTPWANRCLGDADVILLVGIASADPVLSAVEHGLLEAKTQARHELVLLHPADCAMPSSTEAWLAQRRAGPLPVQAHHHVRMGHGGDVRRMARRVSGKPVGVVLAGGGARGWAHVGVLRALTEAGLEVDWVAGASMGALIAGGYALDWPEERLMEIAARISNPKHLLDYTFPYTSVTATQRITALLQNLASGIDIEDTWRPFFCVSAGAEHTHLSGPLWKALRASMAFPAIFAPLLDNRCVLVDGGAANNLPVDRMRELCPTGTVIGVNLLTRPPLDKPYEFGPSLSGWHALLARLTSFGRPLKVPTILDIVAGIVDSSSRYRLNEVRDKADLLIEVPVEEYGLLEFDKYPEIVESGYTAAREQLKRAAAVSTFRS